MLILNKLQEKRKWELIQVDDVGNFKKKLLNLELKGATAITNKFEIVSDLISNICLTIPEFSDWLSDLILDYIESDYNSEILLGTASEFLNMSEKYIDTLNVNFAGFTKIDKTTKTSIIFYESDNKAIAISSTCLKLYALFCYDIKLSLPENAHKKMYDDLVKPCIINNTANKMFQLIRSRIYRSSITDRYMWDLIKMAILETPESYVMKVFNFLMINMLCTLSPKQNPIPFLVSIIDDSIRWLMRTVYKDRIIYGEAFGGPDDIYGSSVSKESFYVYCCNDSVGKAAKIGMSLLETEHMLTGDEFDQVRDRVDLLDILTPPMKLLILPIASKVFEIPYKYLLTCSPKHALLMGIFLHYLSKDILDERFPIINEFLISYPTDIKSLSTRSLYKTRNLEFILNDDTPIFGFAAKTFKWEVMNSICGVLSVSKKNLVSIIDGKILRKMSFFNLEHDVIQFFTLFYSNQLDSVFEQMRIKAESYF